MCFSAGASLAASAGLGAIGVASYKTATKKEKIIAVIPFLFSIQQLFEGLQWISISCGTTNPYALYGFLFFALLFWPVYVPVALFLIDVEIRHILRWFIALGIGAALFYGFAVLHSPLGVDAIGQTLHYYFYVPLNWVGFAMYFTATCGGLAISTKQEFRWFGLALFACASLAAIFYYISFISVWCFFAALLSSLIYFYLRQSKARSGEAS